ncbi:hypothetical protein BJ138DRAFT_1160745 [Hygrophoropsis aurantiaca]|uniref:Uncharacterized protein n=1 Tax=Hygrophoropsis aurantiaca TaxID=72124 RepID=A0ACB8A0X7_9AGAM|nr:hypothetical protein BJ138DRAFT_1160745 [Hygrophoropsis aurantiaca]
MYRRLASHPYAGRSLAAACVGAIGLSAASMYYAGEASKKEEQPDSIYRRDHFVPARTIPYISAIPVAFRSLERPMRAWTLRVLETRYINSLCPARSAWGSVSRSANT